MGKGFNNYMCKKFFHPASADNLKRVWIAQKKADADKKAQDDLRRQYDREQELYNNKSLLSKESKEKLELNFMYEPPPGVKKIGEKDKEEEGEPEYKFEWQRTWGHAPKESYLQKGDDFQEQPFGIQVCQAKCIKCGKYGHMNTDKRCALYGKSLDHDAPIQNVDQARLLSEMRADGLAMRYSTWDIDAAAGTSSASRDALNMVEEERGVDRVEMLKNMSKDEKKKLLKKLKKMEKKDKKKSKKDKKKRSRSSDDSEVEWEEKGASSTASTSSKENKASPKNRIKDERRDRSPDAKRRDRSRSRDRKDRSRSLDRRRRSPSGDRKDRRGSIT
eukprot:TRINITY_DN2203_c0_g1_i12.p1 TRINITY_DN2203_c0_g1~~TRINITY_DN2203_c0_g1_i12.p1  ORF type:complete len:332 (-),score=118.01 TRINITY_DN2203_c0_g1_i12:92-1087(-)